MISAGLVLPVEEHSQLIEQYIAAAEAEERPIRDNCRVVVTGVAAGTAQDFVFGGDGDRQLHAEAVELSFAAELPCVAQQVFQRRPQQARVAFRGEPRRDA